MRAASLNALRILKEPRAVPLAVAALADRQTEQIALDILARAGGPAQAGPVADLAKRSPSLEVLTAAAAALTAWRELPDTTAPQQQDLDRSVAEIHGASGSVVRWQVSGPTEMLHDVNAPELTASRTQFAAGTEGRVVLAAKGAEQGAWFQARTEIAVPDQTAVELLASASGIVQIWLNGQSIYRRAEPQPFRIDSDRVSATLAKGINRLVVALQVASSKEPVDFHLRFRRKSAAALHERLAAAVLARPGNIDRGRSLLLNVEKSLCLKCHRALDQGERTGPELTGVGSRFSRIYIAESILEPGRTIAPSFGTLVVRLDSGQVMSGVKVAEDAATLTLVDNQGQKRIVAKAAIEEQKASPLSTMPDGLEKRLTPDEFVDLVALLASLKESRP